VKTRLQSFLGRAGVSSRRGAAAIILAGRVSVNGAPVFEKGLHIDPERDTVTFDGAPIIGPTKLYFIVHKPKRYISTVRDPFAEKTVLDLVPKESGRLYPVEVRYRPVEGDLLFQSLPHCPLVDAIENATQSSYSHCGMVVRTDGDRNV